MQPSSTILTGWNPFAYQNERLTNTNKFVFTAVTDSDTSNVGSQNVKQRIWSLRRVREIHHHPNFWKMKKTSSNDDLRINSRQQIWLKSSSEFGEALDIIKMKHLSLRILAITCVRGTAPNEMQRVIKKSVRQRLDMTACPMLNDIDDTGVSNGLTEEKAIRDINFRWTAETQKSLMATQKWSKPTVKVEKKQHERQAANDNNTGGEGHASPRCCLKKQLRWSAKLRLRMEKYKSSELRVWFYGISEKQRFSFIYASINEKTRSNLYLDGLRT